MRYSIFYSIAVFTLFAPTTHAQGSFQNLDFESANLTAIPSGQFGGFVPVSEALPGWTAYVGGVQQIQVVQNDLTTGSGSIDIFGPDWTGGPGIIDGDYTILFQPGGLNATASIAQTGTIPSGTQTLLFDASQNLADTASISFNGNNLTPVLLSSATTPSGQAYSVYGVNVAAYAGDMGQLEFTAAGQFNGYLLDDISFSPIATPEPGPWILMVIGGLLVFIRKR